METTDLRHNGTVERTDHIKLQSVVMVQWQMQDFFLHAHFQALLREVSYSTCQSIRFQLRSLLRHAEVSHRSRFLSFSHRQEGSI